MTPLFVPGAAAGEAAVRAYSELRERTAHETGRAMRTTQIFALNARRRGADSWTRVGEPDPETGGVVRAIFASRGGYTVVGEDGHVDLSDRLVYEAVPFE